MSDALACWLSVLDVAPGPANQLSTLFQCGNCEFEDRHGRRRVKALGIDGTATGILSNLLPHDDGSILMASLPTRHAAEQFFASATAYARRLAGSSL
jgi:hypothetical protein